MPNVLLYACKYFILNKPDDAIDVDITCVVFAYLFENVVVTVKIMQINNSDSQLSSETLSFTKMEIAETNFGF